MAKQLEEYQKDGGAFARQISRGAPVAIERQAILQRHSPGEGDLIGDVQTVRLGPGGENRYYVRAQLTLEGRSVFFISCWVDPESHRVERVDFTPSSMWVRYWYFSLKNLPMILNVFDADGDGWGEVLMGSQGYEDFRMTLVDSEAGFEETGVAFSGGC